MPPNFGAQHSHNMSLPVDWCAFGALSITPIGAMLPCDLFNDGLDIAPLATVLLGLSEPKTESCTTAGTRCLGSHDPSATPCAMCMVLTRRSIDRKLAEN
jgi:hypothetical protein